MLQFIQENIAIILALQFAQIGWLFYKINQLKKLIMDIAIASSVNDLFLSQQIADLKNNKTEEQK